MRVRGPTRKPSASQLLRGRSVACISLRGNVETLVGANLAAGTPPRATDCQRSSARDHGFELVERLSDKVRQLSFIVVADPTFECDLEDDDPYLGRQCRSRLFLTASAQRAGNAAASVENLINSRACSPAFATMTAWRCRA